MGVILATTGCGGDDVPPTPVVDERCDEPVGACASRWCSPPPVDARHVDACTVLSWNSNPPTSGPHYGIWASFAVYSSPVPRGFYLHSMEHSAVVLAYNCDLVAAPGGDCAALAAELAQFRAGQPKDDLCTDAVYNRIVVTPDPLLEVPFAAAAWGHMIKADCFDAAEIASFVVSYYGMNYENFCTDGIDPTADFPPDCGRAM